MPYHIYEQLGREEMKKVDRGITMINHTQAEAMEILINVLCHVGVTTLIAKFLILDIPIDRDAPIVVGQGFLRTIGGIDNTPERLFTTFDGFCHQTFRAARSNVMRNAESDSDDEEKYQIKRNKFGAPIYGPKPAPYLNCNDPAQQSLAIQTVTNPFRKISVWKKADGFLSLLPVPLKHVNWKPDYKGSYTKEEEATRQWPTKIRLTDPSESTPVLFQNRCTLPIFQNTMGTHDDEAGSSRSKRSRQHEIVEEIRAFNNYELIYAELCYEFYLTYAFDEVCADDKLQTKKIIKFRLGGRAHNLTLLEFSRRLGLFHANELEEDGFNGLSRSHTSTIWSPIFRFILKIAKKSRVLTDDVVRSLSASIYYRDLDTTPLRDLIDSEGKLITKDPQPGVQRVGIPRPPRASMQDLYQGVFENMDGVYSVPLQGAYNPPSYAQPQYDQLYQQFPPPPPQYQQQQDDDV
ncbi:hypothetical protein Tco_0925665 [Tanacetum coccineum]|uniref:Uncharacterized protein n=1 Tax=Tanacetum coccineum TaxID=301880 RepID=A0ABQ5D7I7_9ASTR